MSNTNDLGYAPSITRSFSGQVFVGDVCPAPFGNPVTGHDPEAVEMAVRHYMRDAKDLNPGKRVTGCVKVFLSFEGE